MFYPFIFNKFYKIIYFCYIIKNIAMEGKIMKIRIGTRGSRLAITQTNMVINQLLKIEPTLEIEAIIIKTKGDVILDKSLDKIGDKGIFVSEIEEQLKKDNIDLAIHSMKDLPTNTSEEFIVLPVLERVDHRDVLVTKHNVNSIEELPNNSVIGTGSKRREVQLKKLIPFVEVVPIRGNIETRIEKMFEENMDGIILAFAGIERLGLKNNTRYKIIPISHDKIIPAPAQGILACQINKKNKMIISLAEKLVHRPTYLAMLAERSFLKAVEGSCHLPLGAYLDQSEDKVKFNYLFGDVDCEKIISNTYTFENSSIISEEELIKIANICADFAKIEVNK